MQTYMRRGLAGGALFLAITLNAGPFTTIKNERAFKQLVARNRYVVVMFHATWCGACKSMKATEIALAKKFKGTVIMAEVDIDAAREVTAAHAIDGIPTYLFYKNGEQRGDALVGAMSKEAFENHITQLIAD